MPERAPLVNPMAPELDVSGFEPKQPLKKDQDIDAIRQASEQAGLVSREPTTPKPAKIARKGNYRTGRNTPFSAKVSLECNNGFYAIAARQNWTMGEVLERALAALERELSKG
jgi:hypothetical protein